MDEKTLSSQRIYEGKVVSLRVDSVRLADGRETKREVIEHSAAVAIVPIDPEGNVLLVRQYRRPAGAEMLELPAGAVDDGEEPEAAAQRELQEETGFRAIRIRRLTGFWVAPGYTTEYIHVFLAEGLVESRLDPDDDEAIEVEAHSLAASLAMIDVGQICDGKTIVGLLAVARERAGNSN